MARFVGLHSQAVCGSKWDGDGVPTAFDGRFLVKGDSFEAPPITRGRQEPAGRRVPLGRREPTRGWGPVGGSRAGNPLALAKSPPEVVATDGFTRVKTALLGERPDRVPRGELIVGPAVARAVLGAIGRRGASPGTGWPTASPGAEVRHPAPRPPATASAPSPATKSWPTLEGAIRVLGFDMVAVQAGRLFWQEELSYWAGRDLFVWALVDGPFQGLASRIGWEGAIAVVAGRAASGLGAGEPLDQPIEAEEARAREEIATALAGGADGIVLGEDVAHRYGLFFSLATIEETLAPRWAGLVRLARSRPTGRGDEALPAFHSDGAVKPLLGLLETLGFQAVHSLEPECGLDPARLLPLWRGRLGLLGGVSLTLLQTGRPHAVRDEAARLQAAGAGGGYVLGTSAGVLPDDVPTENLLALYGVPPTAASGAPPAVPYVSVRFEPSGSEARVAPGTTILQAARDAGVPCGDDGVALGSRVWQAIAASCGGRGTCGQCLVRVEGGRLSGVDEMEVEVLARRGVTPTSGFRQACRARLLGPARIFLAGPAVSATAPEVGPTSPPQGGPTPAPQVGPTPAPHAGPLVALPAGAPTDPPVRRVAFRLEPPSLDKGSLNDASRLTATLAAKLGPAGGPPRLGLDVLRALPAFLRANGFAGSALVRSAGSGPEVIALGRELDPPAEALLGLAVDLGTTKIAAYLVDLETGGVLRSGAAPNPQALFGADVVTRLGAAVADPEDGRRLARAAAAGINDLAARLCREVGLSPDAIVEAVIAGNTAMHHLLLRLPPSGLVAAPYVPVVSDGVDVRARALGLDCHPGAYVYLLPNVAAFVGGDHVAATLVAGLSDAGAEVDSDAAAEGGGDPARDATSRRAGSGVAGFALDGTLLLDIGTNTEISLASGGHIFTCSCASGPAFEGGHISRGMRAVPGAIDHVWLEDGEVRYSVVAGEPGDEKPAGRGGAPDPARLPVTPIGFCGAGLIELLAVMLATGGMDAGGRLATGADYVVGGVPLTQDDVRQLQLAKAAVRSGIEGLLRVAGEQPGGARLRRVLLAGAFGTAIDPEAAMAVGLFPRLPRGSFVPLGNAAGAGACLALTSVGWRRKAEALARRLHYVELVSLPGYQEIFLSNLRFPENERRSG